MPDLSYIPGETRLYLDRIGVDLHPDDNLSFLNAYIHTGKVFDPLEGHVELEHLRLDVVPECLDVSPQRLDAILQDYIRTFKIFRE